MTDSAQALAEAPKMDPVHLLLVEDDDGDALLVTEELEQAGLARAVLRARTLNEALLILADRPVDCVLLDLNLPDARGLDVVHRVLDAVDATAVVCLTGLADDASGAAAVAAGAQDYLVKGSVTGELLARAIRYAVQRKRADEQSIQLHVTRLRAEETARLERGLLPRISTRDPDLGVTVRYRTREGGLLGGDFFDVVEVADGRVFVLLGDVAGQGPEEAALGVSLRVAWRALVLADVPCEHLLGILETVVIHERRTEDVYVQLSMLVIDADRLSATLWLAAHLPPMLLDPSPAQLPGNGDGPALGLLPPGAWSGRRIELPARWRILMYTDGLVEGRGGSGLGQILGVPGLLSLATASLGRDDAAHTVDELLERVRQLNDGELPDDFALVAVQWPVSGRPVAGQRR